MSRPRLVRSICCIAMGCGVLASGACRPGAIRTSDAAPSVSSTGPAIDSIVPASVVVRPGNVVEIAVYGHGFAIGGQPGRNTVRIGSVEIANVPANRDGSSLRFTVPSVVQSGGEAPPAAMHPGPYRVMIVTPAGRSNARTLTVMP